MRGRGDAKASSRLVLWYNGRMRHKILLTGICGAALCVGAGERGIFGLYGDTPDAKHAWAVHDFNRPYPKQVETPAGKPPSDAIVLFDGTQESVDRNWCAADGKPTKWRVKDGAFVCTPRSGMACTRQSFGDAQLHVEWLSPVDDARKHGQLGGNSGVFPMGLYEIQILNSYDPDPDAKVERNYPDGIAGSAYAENPPLVNASRPAGMWQSYDIVFHQPVWKDGKVLHPGTVTVFQNGVLVQDAWELEGMSTHRVRRPLVPHATKLPWKLQDHGDPVPFRNIWIREIPSRWDNTTHSCMSAKEADVTALREQTAAKLFAQVDPATPDPKNVNGALEVLAYSLKPDYVAAAKKLCADYEARLKSLSDKDLDAERTFVIGTLKGFNVLIENKVVGQDDFPLRATLQQIATRKKWPVR